MNSAIAQDYYGSLCDVLIFGGRGLAGRAIEAEARKRGLRTIAASRSGEVQVDGCNAGAIDNLLQKFAPKLIINVAALASVTACEVAPNLAWQINARAPYLLAEYANAKKAKLVHISTDHYYSGDLQKKHREEECVTLLNEYARSKFAAESLLMIASSSLVVRTNIIGLQSATGSSFGEWLANVIIDDLPSTLFEDQFVSSLDVWNFAKILFDLIEVDAKGVMNVANSEVFSKAKLGLTIAKALGRSLTNVKTGAMKSGEGSRADSLGLDVSRAETILGRTLPNLQQVVYIMAEQIVLQRKG